MWFGTLEGLNQYDGHNVKVYAHDDDPTSLRDNLILSLLEDREGTLWVGTSSGLDRFDADTGRFEHLDYHQSSGLSLAAKSILVLHEGRGRTLWVGTNEGLYHVDVETGALVKFPLSPTSWKRFGGRPSYSLSSRMAPADSGSAPMAASFSSSPAPTSSRAMSRGSNL